MHQKMYKTVNIPSLKDGQQKPDPGRVGIMSKLKPGAMRSEPHSAKATHRGSSEAIIKSALRNTNLDQSMMQRLSDTIGDITGSTRRLDDDADTQTSLDAQLSKIESIVDPKGPAFKHLTAEQIEAVEGLRDALLMGTLQLVGGNRDVVPTTVLERCDADNTSMSAYIASEFGGVKIERKRSFRKVALTIKKKSSVARAIASLTLNGAGQNNSCNLLGYAPPEWTKLSAQSRSVLKEKLSLQALSEWSFDIFDIAKHCNDESPLVLVGWAILGSPHAQRAMGDDTLGPDEGYDFVKQFQFTPETLCNFLREVESDYNRANPYHNNIHAADVVQSMYSLLRLGGEKYTTAPLQVFALLLAAAAHDMGHPGKNNTYQVNARTEQALHYNDRSVLEHMHSSRAFHLLLGSSKRKDIDILGSLQDDQVTSVRNLMVKAILGTDMSKHFSHINHIKGIKGSIDSSINEKGPDVLQFMLHLADISNPAKKRPTSVQWANRALDEFFAQGDAEKEAGLPVSPLCDRDKEDKADSQVGSIQFVVKPAFELLGELIPKVKDEILPVVDDNLAFWKMQKELSNHELNSVAEEEQ